MPPARLRRSFKPGSQLKVFYTGGSARLSRDGQLLACACGDDISIVSAAGGAVQRTLKGDTEPVTALCFSRDGLHIYGASRSLQTRQWDVSSGQLVRAWKPHTLPVLDLATDASGMLLATASADRTARVWDAVRGYCTHAFKGHEAPVQTVIFHPDAAKLLLFTGSDDTQVRIWNLTTRACAAVLKSHFSAVTSLSVDPSGSWLVSAGRDKVVTVWSLSDNSKKTTIAVYETLEGVVAIPPGCTLPGADPNKDGFHMGCRFATVGEKGTVRVWSSGGSRSLYDGPADAAAAAQEATFNGIQLLPGAAGFCVTVSDGRVLFYESAGASGDKRGAKQPAAGGAESSAAAAQKGAGKGPALALTRTLIGNLGDVVDGRFLPGGTSIAVATNSASPAVLDAETLAATASLSGHTATVMCIDSGAAPAAHGAPAVPVVVTGSKDRFIRVWSGTTGRCYGIGEGHVAAVTAVAFGHRGAGIVASGSADKLLKVWDVAAAVAEAALGSDPAAPLPLRVTAAVAAHDKDVNAIAISPNDALVATGGGDRVAKLWKLPNLLPHGTLRGHRRGVWDVKFSPVDQVVATASGDKTLKLWALKDLSCVRTFEGHTAAVLKVVFVTAGTQLASAGGDGLVKVWAIASSDCVGTFDEHEDKVWALAAADDGARLLSGGGDAALTVWRDVTAEEEEAEAEEADRKVQAEQELSNALAGDDFRQAVELAFRLERPRQLHGVFTTLLSRPGGDELASEIVGAFEGDRLRALLEHVREWNTNSRMADTAQRLLWHALRRHPPSELLKVPGIGALVDGLSAYTQRHFARVDRLVRSTFLMDFTLNAMGVLDDEAGGQGGGGAGRLQFEPLEDGDADGEPAAAQLKQRAPAAEARGERGKAAAAAAAAGPSSGAAASAAAAAARPSPAATAGAAPRSRIFVGSAFDASQGAAAAASDGEEDDDDDDDDDDDEDEAAAAASGRPAAGSDGEAEDGDTGSLPGWGDFGGAAAAKKGGSAPAKGGAASVAAAVAPVQQKKGKGAKAAAPPAVDDAEEEDTEAPPPAASKAKGKGKAAATERAAPAAAAKGKGKRQRQEEEEEPTPPVAAEKKKGKKGAAAAEEQPAAAVKRGRKAAAAAAAAAEPPPAATTTPRGTAKKQDGKKAKERTPVQTRSRASKK